MTDERIEEAGGKKRNTAAETRLAKKNIYDHGAMEDAEKVQLRRDKTDIIGTHKYRSETERID